MYVQNIPLKGRNIDFLEEGSWPSPMTSFQENLCKWEANEQCDEEKKISKTQKKKIPIQTDHQCVDFLSL